MFHNRSLACLSLWIGIALTCVQSNAEENPPVVELLKESRTVLGQTLAYPTTGQAHIQSLVVTMLPGEETGPHTHPHPTYGFIMEGELTVSYPHGVEKVYRRGEAVMEAVDTLHNGRNSGDVPVRILVVFMGVEGKANSIAQNGQ